MILMCFVLLTSQKQRVQSTAMFCRDVQLTKQFMTYIQNSMLLGTDSHPAAGLAYHIADVFVAELTTVSGAGQPSAAALNALLEPFCQAMAHTSRAAFLPRLRYDAFLL